MKEIAGHPPKRGGVRLFPRGRHFGPIRDPLLAGGARAADHRFGGTRFDVGHEGIAAWRTWTRRRQFSPDVPGGYGVAAPCDFAVLGPCSGLFTEGLEQIRAAPTIQ
jgi:hypothetical protein